MSTLEKEPANSYPGSVNSGYPGQVPSPSHQTVVAINSNDPNQAPLINRTEINLNIGYFKTLPGVIKIVQLLFGIICMACSSPAREYIGIIGIDLDFGVGENHWFLFVVVTSFIFTLLWCFFYLLQLAEAISMKLPFSWLKLVRIGNLNYLLSTRSKSLLESWVATFLTD